MKLKKPFKNEVMKTIAYYAKLLYRTKKSYYFAYLISIVLDGAIPVINILFGKLVMESLINKTLNRFLLLVGLLVIINLIGIIIKNRCSNFMNAVYNLMQTEFEISIADKITRLQYGVIETAEFHDKHASAKVGISWYSGGIAGVARNINIFISNAITILGTLTILASFSLLIIILIIFISILNIVVTALAQKRDVAFRKRLTTVNRKLGYFLNIFKDQRISKEVRLYNANDLIESKVNHFLETEWKIERKRTKFGNKIRAWIDVINYANQAFLYTYFAWQTIRSLIDISYFTMYVNAGITFYISIVSITTQYVEIEKNTYFLKDYIAFMQIPEKNQTENSIHMLPAQIECIEFKNVTFQYPQSSNFALENISLKIFAREKIALVGLNGAGKTTFIKLLCRLYNPTAGEILLNNLPLSCYKEDEYKKLISAVFQDYKFFPFSISDNITAGEFNKDDLYHALKTVDLDSTVESLLKKENTKLTKLFDEDGIDFSGGEKQRLAIARALYKKAEVIVLDEPTASLDPIAEFQIFNMFHKIIGKRTALFISHRLSACIFCDRIILFHDGKIKNCGSHYEMLKKDELYREMWEAQSQYYVK